MLDDALRTAFLATEYRIGDGAWSIDLHPDQPSEALRRWMRDAGYRSATLLTAFNPGSKPFAAATNAAAQRRLRTLIQQRGLPCLEGRNIDPSGRWPTEDSLLVGNLTLADSQELARQFGQLAFLWIDDEAVPRLHETPPI